MHACLFNHELRYDKLITLLLLLLFSNDNAIFFSGRKTSTFLLNDDHNLLLKIRALSFAYKLGFHAYKYEKKDPQLSDRSNVFESFKYFNH